MARTKNRGYQQPLTPTYTIRRWKMGVYIRIPREDLQKINRGLDDSNSVKNQRDILINFPFNHAEEFESYIEYVDDGHTGTNVERESFQQSYYSLARRIANLWNQGAHLGTEC